jgi:hypothetical protein
MCYVAGCWAAWALAAGGWLLAGWWVGVAHCDAPPRVDYESSRVVLLAAMGYR